MKNMKKEYKFKEAFLSSIEWLGGNIFQVFFMFLVFGAMKAFLDLLIYTSNITDTYLRVLLLLVLLNTLDVVARSLNKIEFNNKKKWRDE